MINKAPGVRADCMRPWYGCGSGSTPDGGTNKRVLRRDSISTGREARCERVKCGFKSRLSPLSIFGALVYGYYATLSTLRNGFESRMLRQDTKASASKIVDGNRARDCSGLHRKVTFTEGSRSSRV